MKTITLIFITFYLGIGIGTVLKYTDRKMNFEQVIRIIFIVPFETIVIYLMVYFGCFAEVYKSCKKAMQITTVWGRIDLFFKVAVSGLYSCFKFMPIVAGRIVLNLLKDKKISHFMKKTSNDCQYFVIKELCYQH